LPDHLHNEDDPSSSDNTGSPISKELDEFIRLQDAGPNGINENLERFEKTKTHWETANAAMQEQNPVKFDINHPLIAAYFTKIKAILDKQNYSLTHFNPANTPITLEDKKTITQECIQIARDIILIIGPETYKIVKDKIQNPYFAKLDPQQIMFGTTEEILEFYMENNRQYAWSHNPVAWAKDCLLLLLNPALVKNLEKPRRHITKNMRPTVEGWLAKIEGVEEEKRSHKPQLKDTTITIQGIDEALVQSFIDTLKKAKIDPTARMNNITYNPSADSFTRSAGNMIPFINNFFKNYEGDKTQLQYRILRAAEKIAQTIKDQIDISAILEAIEEFRTMAKEGTEMSTEIIQDGKVYKAETDIRTNTRRIRIIQQSPPKLICKNKTLEEINTLPGITKTDLEIATKLLTPSQDEEEKIKNFRIKDNWSRPKFKRKNSKEIRVLYALTHFLAITLPNLHQPTTPTDIQENTQRKTTKTLGLGEKA